MTKLGKRRLTAGDLYRFEYVSGAAIAPDGRRVAYTVERVDRKTEAKYANIWMVPTAGGRARQFTWGDHRDTVPCWSPDSKALAFLSNRNDEKQTQIFLIPADGGEARPLTSAKGEFGELAWSPDGRRIVCSFRKRDAEVLEREKDEQKKKLGVVSRHITRLFFKEDAQGFHPKERWHLWVFDARSGKGRQLTDGAVHDELWPAWSPDGKQLVFGSNRQPDPDMDPEAYRLYVMPVAGGPMRALPGPDGLKMLPRFSPDGKQIAYLGMDGKNCWWKGVNLWTVAANGRSAPLNLTGALDRTVGADTIGDMINPPTAAPVWSADGRELFVQVSHHGRTGLMAVSAAKAGLAPEPVVQGDGVVGWFSLDRESRRLAYFYEHPGDPGNLYVKDRRNGRTRRLTRHNDNLLARIDLGTLEEVWFKGSSGNDLQGWVLKPPGFRAGRTYPSILEIHGGPLVQYGFAFMHEFYCLAAGDYVVYFSNPRGGYGYGARHARAIWNNWGTADYDDLMAWADVVKRKPYIDARRMGVTGGSYGGYMTNWIIGHTPRFAAAVTQRSVSNLLSMWGSSDFNWHFQVIFGDKPPWEGFANLWRQSPMKHIGNARTPTLVIHSESDLRCAIEQGEQVFVALKRLGVATEMVRFPDEPHGLSRGGRTDRRVVRLEQIARWFDRYLKRR